ncbi:MAG: FAD/NAD(P)-binding protein [Proteobacteria bacterium]|nr:FAD/NAD(P)-binding protein [Pseudomonadota bacterium]MBU1140341.1 FAD/NAD(P)-binding protein [Pseudomonadota bacterium]MBU1234088.1 FAD/NAD(P)-binding protein [Pseudomonadota bacterium]MBU1417176.1 FAD/NAD(P)-binding protein [Pseudomonadota bacterium]MBU1453650.1 FAD/NAD(P)-binding protein [Pseudomonadota bacterium]
MKENFIPERAVIREIIIENEQIRTFRLELLDKTHPFTFLPGQFLMLSVPHCGEAAISISSSPTALPLINLSIRKAGELTAAVHTMQPGAQVGIRGPFGKPFPVNSFSGRSLLFVAGGIGLAPLKGVIDYCLFQQELEEDSVQDITLLYGSRMPSDIGFRQTIKKWQEQGVTCRLIVDIADEEWQGAVGLVTDLLDMCTVTEKTTALVCGPPIMIRFVIARLSAMGCADDAIITTLERHMKCGMGICGHCHLDGKLVCVDGPVFNLAQLKTMDVMELG